ncbi:urease accessory protein UreF [Helicobacter jaachi]|uniref:Urease accessory protein UreF n=1 Tax=Helicobacter jaachi TaxID=1677920 RepID=A0A4V6I2D7_9HELI|nr:urease accessory protein UreF [Helicobacter jaachi]TLD95742.1 urease accessory protein UreF [Helicobacter jaachi]
MTKQDFLLLQINDSLFPIGSFQHSFGLESYVLGYMVVDSKTMLNFMQSYLQTSFLYNDLLSLKICFESANDIHKILEIQSLLHALTIPQEIREANHKLGIRFIKTIESMGVDSQPLWQNYIAQSIYPTHATSYAIFCAAHNMPYHKAMSAFLYAQSANMVINGVKLIPLSQDDGQWILNYLQDTFLNVLDSLNSLTLEDLGASTPLYDILAMKHQYLYSRLYMS